MSRGSLVVTSPTQKKPDTTAVRSKTPAPTIVAAAEPCTEPLTAEEREHLISEAEWGFRTWLRETSPPSGYVMYPSTRQIHKSLSALHDILEDVDLSDIAL
ncbi:hypothetical protein IW140_004361 [Coemansia sp. RSA 1813]|nr:hypothetical protein EV178_004432 [Coemansia sp. RSA 1646]KAJ1768454.1 hypothetical protein LPJ74_004843 [Coemansia sp. RSA 1843]KAJ2087917.1 hypothetical protein IW138_004615 [Coemansia sp. RSA 986]KAJ2212887.1 hypothetical protein EV179_004288 [Coemansia sp. RSA 487]KAJ2567658.1 hypothetical protein IW140_004361 [Coemansia sp. RSA 1813]